MNELQGSLIEMNAHMVRQERFDIIIAFGVVSAIVFVMIAAFVRKESKRAFVSWLVLAAVGIAVAIIGSSQPLVKEIKMCANGPVSIEQISAIYDIVDIDGKMITLRDRCKVGYSVACCVGVHSQ